MTDLMTEPGQSAGPRVGRARWPVLVPYAVLAAGFLLRWLFLDADLAYGPWAGYVMDEGRWTEQARRWALTGTIDLDHGWARVHLALAPLFQFFTAVSYELFGVGFTSSRLVSVLSGSTLLVVVWLFLRRHLPSAALAIVLSVLAFHPDLVFLSRVAIPEMAAMLFSLLAFLAVASGGGRLRTLAGGVATVAAMGFKATVGPLAPILVVVAAVTGERRDLAGRLVRAGWFVIGLLLVPAALAAVFLALGGGPGHFNRGLLDAAAFLRLGSPYHAIDLLLYDHVASMVSPLLLCGWVLGGLLVAGRPLPPGRPRDVWIGSTIWIAGWLGAAALLDYFPDRYVIHVVTPLALNVGAGLALMKAGAWERAVERMERHPAWHRLGFAAWLAVPAAVVLAPLAVSAAGLVGVDLDRLRQHLGLIAFGALVMGGALTRWWRPRHVVWIAAAPLLAVFFRWLFLPSGVLGSFWAPAGTAGAVAWLAVLCLAAAVPLLAAMRGLPVVRISIAAFATAVLAGWLPHSVPRVVAPTYTFRDAAAQIVEMARPDDLVGTKDAGGILLGTRIMYTIRTDEPPPPDLFVEAFPGRAPELIQRYDLVARRPLNVGRYTGPLGDAELGVFRLRAEGR
jgi:hypothetical protein